MLLIARALALSVLSPANGTIDSLAASVARAQKPSHAEQTALTAALKAGADAYNAAGAAQAAAKREQADHEAAKASAEAIEKSEAISREVLVGQEEAAKAALKGLRDVGDRDGKASELSASLSQAEQDADDELHALDEATALSKTKRSLVTEAEGKLAEVRKRKEATVKEAETAGQIAKEKQADTEVIAKEEQKAEATLEQAKEEEEAISAMVDHKRSLSAQASQTLQATTAAATAEAKSVAKSSKATATSPASPMLSTTVPAAAVVAARLRGPAPKKEDVESLKAENARLREEKEQLARQLAQQSDPPAAEKALLRKRLDKLKL